MTNYKVYDYDGYYGFRKCFERLAESVEEVIEYLQDRFKEDTELAIQLFGDHVKNGRTWQIRSGRKIITEFQLIWDKNNGYNLIRRV